MTPTLRPFDPPAGIFWFERDEQGRMVQMHLGSGRVWDITFRPQETAGR